jgi:hypothetical protein
VIGELLAGAGIAFGGVLIGRYQRPKRAYRERKVEPICGCKHHHSFHRNGGACHFTDSWGIRCQCQHYRGPEPLPEYYAPELGG